MNPSAHEIDHHFQLWLAPRTTPPDATCPDAPAHTPNPGEWIVLASGLGAGGAAIDARRQPCTGAMSVPMRPLMLPALAGASRYLHVMCGSLAVHGQQLNSGDALVVRDASSPMALISTEAAEVLGFETASHPLNPPDPGDPSMTTESSSSITPAGVMSRPCRSRRRRCTHGARCAGGRQARAELVPEAVARGSGYKRDQPAPMAEPDELARYERDHLRHAHALRQHGRADAQLPGPHGRAVGTLVRSSARWAACSAVTGTQHGGQETTITSFHTTLLHHGMVIVGLPYSFDGLARMDEITGGTPYGANGARRRRRHARGLGQ